MNLSVSQQSLLKKITSFNPTKVDDKLYRGNSIISPLKLLNLKNRGITRVIDLRNSAYLSSIIEKKLCKIMDIQYENHKFSHRQKTLPDSDYFERINNSIMDNQGTTYIHCEYGHHRTGLAVAIHEKLHSQKSDSEIFNNMVTNGYTEILSNGKTKKEKKYLELFNQMLIRYFDKNL